jgi:hypothetical protein
MDGAIQPVAVLSGLGINPHAANRIYLTRWWPRERPPAPMMGIVFAQI